jgi:hypothetical protein
LHDLEVAHGAADQQQGLTLLSKAEMKGCVSHAVGAQLVLDSRLSGPASDRMPPPKAGG